MEPLPLPSEVLAVRAHAAPGAGAGHVMRCLALALAHAAVDGGRATFVLDDDAGPLAERVRSEGFEVAAAHGVAGSAEDATAVAALATERGAKWVVIDGYPLRADYVDSLKASGLRVLAIDDHGTRGPCDADIVLDQNLGADESAYGPERAGQRLLLGTSFALLRPEFAAAREAALARETPGTVGVSLVLGGGAGSSLGEAVATFAATASAASRSVKVVSSDPPDLTELFELDVDVEVLPEVRDMAALMARADLAVSAAGSTAWELACLGVPMILVAIAGNQEPVGQRLADEGAAWYLGTLEGMSANDLVMSVPCLSARREQRDEMRRTAAGLVDGLGAGRVEAARRAHVAVRDALAPDSDFLLEVANDPEVRAASFSAEPVPVEMHERWFAERLARADALTLVGEDFAGRLFGTARFDAGEREGEYVASVAVSAGFRGRGHGAALVERATSELFARVPEVTAVALVKAGNKASLASFASAGYVDDGDVEVRGHAARRLVRRRG